MNIFVSDTDPRVAARNLDNKRVNKMILESSQMLSLALDSYNIPGPKLLKKARKHPCISWANASRENYTWLLWHLRGLLSEFTYRRGKIHKWEEHYPMLKAGLRYLPKTGFTLFENCTSKPTKNIDFKHIRNPITAYRKYLMARWATDEIKVVWEKRGCPSWLKQYLRGHRDYLKTLRASLKP